MLMIAGLFFTLLSVGDVASTHAKAGEGNKHYQGHEQCLSLNINQSYSLFYSAGITPTISGMIHQKGTFNHDEFGNVPFISLTSDDGYLYTIYPIQTRQKAGTRLVVGETRFYDYDYH